MFCLFIFDLMAGGYRDKYLLHPSKIDRITGYFLDGPPDVPTARFEILFAVDQAGKSFNVQWDLKAET